MKSLSRLKAHRLLLSVVIERDPTGLNSVRSCQCLCLVLTSKAIDWLVCEVSSLSYDLRVEDLQPEASCYQSKVDLWVKLYKRLLELVAVKINKQPDETFVDWRATVGSKSKLRNTMSITPAPGVPFQLARLALDRSRTTDPSWSLR